MKRILLLAYYFPPIAASGSVRPLGLALHLPEFGYECRVVSTTAESVYPPLPGTDDSLVSLIPDDLQVDRLAYSTFLASALTFRSEIKERFACLGSLTRHQRRDQQSHSSPPQSGGAQLSPWARRRRSMVDRAFVFPDPQKPWIAAVRRHVRMLSRSYKPDIVMATGNPWSALVAGAAVAESLGIPFIADYRDPWTNNPKPVYDLGLRTRGVALERRVLSKASLVVANTEELAQWFRRAHPEIQDRVTTVTNGFLGELATPNAPLNNESITTLSHFGSVYELRRPTALFKAALNLIRQGRLSSNDLRLRFVGTWLVEDSLCNQLASELEAAGVLERQAHMAHRDAAAEMANSQHLLILQQDFPLQIPAKIYEYLQYARPLVVIGAEGATPNLVQRNRLGLCVADEAEALETFLSALARHELHVPLAENADRFAYREIARGFAATLDELSMRSDLCALR